MIAFLSDLVLTLHSLVRWVPVVLGITLVIRGLMGWFSKKEYGRLDDRLGLFFTIGFDVQILLGLILYFGLSPMTQAVFADFGAAMKNTTLRFWGVEHIIMMIIAITVAHIGRTVIKRGKSDLAKHQRIVIFYGISILLTLVAIPWPFAMVSRPLLRVFGFTWP